MKIRARKSKYNTKLDFEDFKLKEFSKDKENFVPDLELSCCDCHEFENLADNIDSPISFLIKFKADQLSDPRAVKPGVKGLILPEELSYEIEKVESCFKSIRNNHYNLVWKQKEIEQIAVELYKDGNHHIDISKSEVQNYLLSSYDQDDWKTLLARKDKEKWRKFTVRQFKDRYQESYGKININEIKEALEVDSSGVNSLLSEMKSFGCFSNDELTIIDEVL